MKLEIIECDGYQAIAINGKLISPSSCEDPIDELVGALQTVIDIEYSREVLDDNQDEEFEAWQEARK